MGQHRTAAHAAIAVQGAGHIQLQLFAAPAAQAGRGLDLALRRGALAHQVDGATGLAIAAEQAIGAAHDLHAVVHRQVGVKQLLAEGIDAGAIDLHIANLKAAREKARGLTAQAAGTGVVHGHAGGLLHHLAHGAERLVLDQLVGHHGDGLRCLAHILALAQRHAPAGVRAAAFGGLGALGLGGDQHFRQGLAGRSAPLYADGCAAGHGLQIAASQHLAQRRLQAEAALQRRCLAPLHQGGIHRDGHAPGARQCVEGLAQRLCRQVQALGGRHGRLGGCRLRMHRAGQGQPCQRAGTGEAAGPGDDRLAALGRGWRCAAAGRAARRWQISVHANAL